MSISISNNDKTPFDVTLYHEIYCKEKGDCECTKYVGVVSMRDKQGNIVQKREQRLNPKSLSISGKGSPGSIVTNLHDAVLQIPQIREARKTKKLKIVVAPTEDVPKHTPKSETSNTPRSRRRKQL